MSAPDKYSKGGDVVEAAILAADRFHRRGTSFIHTKTKDTTGGSDDTTSISVSLKVFALAESLGAVESLAESPSLMTHASVPDEQRAMLGIDDTLIRLSVGIESCRDLVDDLDNALKAALKTLENGT